MSVEERVLKKQKLTHEEQKEQSPEKRNLELWDQYVGSHIADQAVEEYLIGLLGRDVTSLIVRYINIDLCWFCKPSGLIKRFPYGFQHLEAVAWASNPQVLEFICGACPGSRLWRGIIEQKVRNVEATDESQILCTLCKSPSNYLGLQDGIYTFCCFLGFENCKKGKNSFPLDEETKNNLRVILPEEVNFVTIPDDEEHLCAWCYGKCSEISGVGYFVDELGLPNLCKGIRCQFKRGEEILFEESEEISSDEEFTSDDEL